MATVLETTPACKPKAFYAHLYDESGVLAKVEGMIYFMAYETGTLTAIEPDHCNFLSVLGEIGLSDTQAIMDQIHGGAAMIACSRLQGVA